jgi:hypothetical protein
MDPLTLFALANGAVQAVKKGCELYKEIKGASGDVKTILKDLEDQFSHKYPPSKPPTVEQKNQYIKEKNRVIELNKQDGDTTNIYTEIGNHLGAYYDNFYKCMAIFEEEEKRSKNEVYTGDSSLGKRALQRVLMRKQLEHMSSELREIMVYQCPPELGALYTEVEDMMKIMGKEQKVAVANQMRRQESERIRKIALKKKLTYEAAVGVAILVLIISVFFLFMLVIHVRMERFPDLGNCIPPKGTWLYREWTKTIWAECS